MNYGMNFRVEDAQVVDTTIYNVSWTVIKITDKKINPI